MHASARPCAIAGSALLASSMIAAMPAVQPAALRVANMDVRLVDADSLLTDVTGALGNLDPLTSLGGLSLPDLGSLDLGGLNLGGIENIPYNLFADIVNIPANEIAALGIYAEALGPAGGDEFVMNTTTGALSQLPFNTPVPSGDIPLGIAGTGSWYMESLGNTWGWDDGNFPQLDGLFNMLLPFPQFTTPLAEEAQIFLEAEIVDGAANNCEFECSDLLGYFGSWFNTPLTQLLSGYTFGDVPEDTVGQNVGSVVNLGPPPFGPPDSGDTIWSDTSATLNPLLPFESLATNLTGSPASNPIEIPNIETLSTNLGNLFTDYKTDFNPFETGSYVYWGAPTAYTVPSLIGGLVQSATGIPNQFPLPNEGAEPVSGYGDTPSSLLTGLPQGFEYLVHGLLGYLDPETYLTALSTDFSTLTGALSDPTALLGDIPFLGLLGLDDPSSLFGPLDLSSLVGSTDPSSLFGPLDLSSLLGSTDPGSLLGSTDLSSLLGSVDPSSLLGSFDPSTLAGDLSTLLASGAANTAITTIPDLALQLLTSF
jgi:hypothetical protein